MVKLSLQSANRAKLLPTSGYYAAFFMFGVVSAVLGPALPTLAENSGVSPGETGVLFTTRGIGFLLGSLAGGRMYDRLRGHPAMAAALLVTALATVLTPLANQFWQLNLLMFVIGFSTSHLMVGCNTLLIWVQAERVGPWLNGMHFVNGIGSFVAPLVFTALLLRTGRIHPTFYLAAALALIIAAGLLFVTSPTVPVDERAAAGEKPAVDWPLLLLLALMFLLYVGVEVGFGGWIYTYIVEAAGANEAVAGRINASFYGLFTLGRLLAIPLAVRFANRQLLLVNYAGSLASLIILLLWPDSLAALTVGTAGLGLFLASTFPVLMAFVGKHLRLTGQINGALFAVTAIGAMLVPWLMGLLFDTRGGSAMMLVVLGAVALGLLTFFFVLSRVRWLSLQASVN
jgi:fucose permease